MQVRLLGNLAYRAVTDRADSVALANLVTDLKRDKGLVLEVRVHRLVLLVVCNLDCVTESAVLVYPRDNSILRGIYGRILLGQNVDTKVQPPFTERCGKNRHVGIISDTNRAR